MNQADQGWIKSTCAYCGVGCGIEARPKLTGELEVRGDQQHPSNYGKLCTKGIALGDTVIQDGRLLTPTVQQQGRKKSLSWSSATNMVASKFEQVIKDHGPEAVAFYVSGQLLTEDYYVANKLIKGFMGSSNIDSNSRLCMASSVVGHKRAFGSDTVPICYDDIEHADMVVLVGSNLAWCHPVLFQRLRSAKQSNPNLNIVVIDPRVTASCDIADSHLPISSGGDVALFNTLLAQMEKQGAIDYPFIEKHTNGFAKALTTAQAENSGDDYADAALATGLSQQQIDQFVDDFIGTEKVLTIYSQGVNQSSSGADKVNSILNCHLATAKIGKKGCGPFSVTGQPNAMGGREVGALANMLAAHMEFDNPEHLSALSEFWGTQDLATQPGLKALDLFDAMDRGEIKAVWIMATNPAVSLPDSDKIARALNKCEFVVVSDCIEGTETAQYADLLLPAQGWSEKSGTVTNSERRISRQRRLLPSPGEAKPDWWIISQVAQKMGFADAFDYLHEGEIFTEYAKLTTLGNEQGERDLNLIGLTQLDEQGYSTLAPQQWPVLELQTDVVNKRFFSDGQFYTPNGLANFVAVSHREPISASSEEFPLLLNSGRSRDQWHTMTRTGLSAKLAEFDPEPYLQVHPSTAQYLDIESDQVVSISSPYGAFKARATITEDVLPEQVYAPIHWSAQTAGQSKPCSVIAPNADPFSGQPEFKHTPVSVVRCDHKSHALVITQSSIDQNVIGSAELDYWVKQKVPQGYLYIIESSRDENGLIQTVEYLLQDTRGRQYQSILAGNRITTSLNYKQEKRYAMWVCANITAALAPSLLVELFSNGHDEMALMQLTTP
ncbi:nitrate reductase [Vibrio sp. qd031]|uniref:molybdopterin oxidoreductase family protein n=1 Tax=Vibrio sp. qd031 TaxID=1603038 RepID=UPI000A0FC539|nr:nitrate reductase [Vibrio sp. qd031]